jgi:hypothetical protein
VVASDSTLDNERQLHAVRQRITGVNPDQVNIVDLGLSLGITVSFGQLIT